MSTSNLIRIGRVIEKTGLSKPTIYRDKTFPKPVRIGARAVAWVEVEVDAWIEARIARIPVEHQIHGDKPGRYINLPSGCLKDFGPKFTGSSEESFLWKGTLSHFKDGSVRFYFDEPS